MKDGNKIRVCDMTDFHLKNTMEMLKKHAVRMFNKELDIINNLSTFFHGDIALDTLDDHARELEENGCPSDFLPDIYSNLEDELERRHDEC